MILSKCRVYELKIWEAMFLVLIIKAAFLQHLERLTFNFAKILSTYKKTKNGVYTFNFNTVLGLWTLNVFRVMFNKMRGIHISFKGKMILRFTRPQKKQVISPDINKNVNIT